MTRFTVRVEFIARGKKAKSYDCSHYEESAGMLRLYMPEGILSIGKRSIAAFNVKDNKKPQVVYRCLECNKPFVRSRENDILCPKCVIRKEN